MESLTDKAQKTLIDSEKIAGISECVLLGKDQLLIGTKHKEIHILDFGFPYDEVYKFHNHNVFGFTDTDVKTLENTYAQLSAKHKRFLDDICFFSTKMQLSELLSHVTQEIEFEKELRVEIRNTKTEEEVDKLCDQDSTKYRLKILTLAACLYPKFGV